MTQTLAALIGSLGTAIALIYGGLALEAYKRRRDRMGMALAIAGAIDAMLNLIETGGVITKFREALCKLDAGQPVQFGSPSLHTAVAAQCRLATLSPPSYQAMQARVRSRDQIWLTRRREGPRAARALRLLTGAHPGADAPWQRVQIDSTPCNILLVRETDRSVIGLPTATFAIDIHSRVVLGFSISLEAASTATVATCLAHACLPKEAWLARRDLSGVHWPVYGRPGTLEYDQGPENEASGIQRGMSRYGIAPKIRAKEHPEQHGIIERLIGTMMRRRMSCPVPRSAASPPAARASRRRTPA